jgi:hypothetical protein
VVLAFTGAIALAVAGCQKDGKTDEGKAPVQVVNDKCPIMGGAINPAKVPAAQTRQFKGQTIGFCCTNCLPAWDKLSDEQKQAKLDAVAKGGAPATHSHEH